MTYVTPNSIRECLMHGFTHSGHPVACAVALATIEAIEREGLLARVRELSETLAVLAAPLREHPEVGEVRQAGLMVGVELVCDKETRQPWPVEAGRGRRATIEARERGAADPRPARRHHLPGAAVHDLRGPARQGRADPR